MCTWKEFLTKVINNDSAIKGLRLPNSLSGRLGRVLCVMFPSESGAEIRTEGEIITELAEQFQEKPISKPTLGNHTSCIYKTFEIVDKGVFATKSHALHDKLLKKFRQLNQNSPMPKEKKYVLSLDLGTTNIRAVLFDITGKSKSSTYKELKKIIPVNHPDRLEHNPIEIWEHTEIVIREMLSLPGVSSDQISSIGLTVQRETCLLWNKKTGVPLHNAISWKDRRTSDKCDSLKNTHEDLIHKNTGLIIDSYFSATKLQWLIEDLKKDNIWDPDNTLAGTIDTWILWNLTKGLKHVTDHTNASRTMLINIKTLYWDIELLKLFKIPKKILPEILPSLGLFGETHASLFGSNIPIYAVLGDQQASLYGHRCNEYGDIKCTYGTGGFLIKFMGVNIPSSNKDIITTVAWTRRDENNILTINYALEGSMFTAGSAVKWLKDGLDIIKDVNDTERLARTVPNNGGVYFVPAFSGLGAPHWVQSARGAFVGITEGTLKAHLVRAVLEAIAYQVKEVIDTMNDSSEKKTSSLRVDGGACVNNFLMQFQADLLEIPVERPVEKDITAQGAAFAAGLASGFWKDLTRGSIPNAPEIQVFNPDPNYAYAREFESWKEAVKHTKNWNCPSS